MAHIRDFVLYALVILVLITTFPSRAETNPLQPEKFEAGVNVLFKKSDFADIGELDWKLDTLFDRLQVLRVNAVSLSWLVYTDGVRSNTLYRGLETPPDEALAFFIKKAVGQGFRVIVRPIIDEQSISADGKDEWRGTIRPRNVGEWFESYTVLLLEYAAIADAAGAVSLAIATELTSMEEHINQWRELIAKVRQKFSGKLTYSSNQGISEEMPWDALDFIGVDAFLKLDTPQNATVEDMVRAWQKWVPRLERRASQLDRPLVFTEIGVTSQKKAHRRSWVWDHRSGVDLEDQRRFYASACTVWKPRLAGIYWWAVNANLWVVEDPLTDKGFTPMGKPAEAEILKCYSGD